MYEKSSLSQENVITDTISNTAQPRYVTPKLLRLTPNLAQSGNLSCANEALGSMGHTIYSGTANYSLCSVS